MLTPRCTSRPWMLKFPSTRRASTLVYSDLPTVCPMTKHHSWWIASSSIWEEHRRSGVKNRGSGCAARVCMGTLPRPLRLCVDRNWQGFFFLLLAALRHGPAPPCCWSLGAPRDGEALRLQRESWRIWGESWGGNRDSRLSFPTVPVIHGTELVTWYIFMYVPRWSPASKHSCILVVMVQILFWILFHVFS